MHRKKPYRARVPSIEAEPFLPPAESLSVGEALFGKTRQAVLALLFGRAGRSFSTREIVGITGFGSGQIQRELANLAASELVTRRRSAGRVLHCANPDAPAGVALAQLVAHSFGLADPLREVLAPLAGRIDLAMIVGRAARGEYIGVPPVDLVLCGRFEDEVLAPLLLEAERKIGRRIELRRLDQASLAKMRREQHRVFLRTRERLCKVVLFGRFDEARPLLR